MQDVVALFISIIRLLWSPLGIVFLLFVIRQIKIEREYKASAYYRITKHPYLSMRRDLGRYGEYLTYKQLKHYEADGAQFLFNLYIPKGNGETTEIDVLMIHKKGLFIFESKNFSGWIFGDEKKKYWYQTLPSGRGGSHKESFYNPIMQNQSHIKHLKAFLGEPIPTWSFVVFSNRCTLKDVHINSPDIRVVYRHELVQMVDAFCYHTAKDSLTDVVIYRLYNQLSPYTQVDEATKQQHIYDIHNKRNLQPTQRPVESIHKPAATHIVAPTREAPQGAKCPKCNGELVMRTATKGANAGHRFLGCANYPKCKYVQQLNKQSTQNETEKKMNRENHENPSDSKNSESHPQPESATCQHGWADEKLTHHMKLNPRPFAMMQSGQKTIELRLLDEKRQKIKVGDRIIFTNIETGETLHRTVVKLHLFDSFEALYSALPLLKCGYTAENVDKAHHSDVEAYFSTEKQRKYGVVGIELQ